MSLASPTEHVEEPTVSRQDSSMMVDTSSKSRRGVTFVDPLQKVSTGTTVTSQKDVPHRGTSCPINSVMQGGYTSLMDSFASAHDSKGYVTVDDEMIQSLTTQHFAVSVCGEMGQSTSIVPPFEEMAEKFRFERSARRSFVGNLGLGANVGHDVSRSGELPGRRREVSSMDVYAKINDESCVNIYFACLVGIGSFSLSSALAKCGLIPGLIAMTFFSGVHVFLCHRLVEVPQLIEQSFELYASLAKATLPRAMYKITAFSCILTWFTGCYMFQKASLANVVKSMYPLDGDPDMKLDMCFGFLKPIFIIILIPLSWYTNVALVSRAAKWQVRAMIAAGTLECLAALVYLFVRWGHVNFWNCRAWGNHITDGLQSMALAHIGIGILPYIVAEMIYPKHATKVINKACGRITTFYMLIAVLGYVGWGDDVLKCEKSPLIAMIDVVQTLPESYRGLRWFYYICAYLVVLCFTVKTMCAFPMFLWPLVRECEGFLRIEDSPAAEIILPWATQGKSKRRLRLKAALVILMIVPLMLPGKAYVFVLELSIYGPMCFTHLALPALAAFVGIWKHWEAVDLRQARQLTLRQIENGGMSVFATTPANRTRPYFCGKFIVHFWASALSALLMMVFCSVVLFQWACENTFPLHWREAVCPEFLHPSNSSASTYSCFIFSKENLASHQNISTWAIMLDQSSPADGQKQETGYVCRSPIRNKTFSGSGMLR